MVSLVPSRAKSSQLGLDEGAFDAGSASLQPPVSQFYSPAQLVAPSAPPQDLSCSIFFYLYLALGCPLLSTTGSAAQHVLKDQQGESNCHTCIMAVAMDTGGEMDSEPD